MNLHQRLNQIYKEIKSVHKGAEIKAGYSSYKAVLHDDVTRLLHEPMAEHGIVCLTDVIKHDLHLMQVVRRDGKEATDYRSEVTCKVILVNMDDPSDKIELTSHAFAIDSGDKSYGKAVSMAVKYALLKAFMLESKDDEESRVSEPVKAKYAPKKATDAQKLELTNLLKAQDKFSDKTEQWLNTITSDIATLQINKLKEGER